MLHVRLKLIFLALILISCSGVVNAQSPSWLWARGVNSDTSSIVSVSIATDDDDDIAICGYYNGVVNIEGTELASADIDRINFFVALYDKSGTLQWAKKVGDVLNSQGAILNVIIDSNRNVYVFGYYQDSAVFNDIDEHSPNFTSIFGVGFDKQGNRLWVNTLAKNVKSYDGLHQSGYEFGSGEINGTIYIAGSFDDSLLVPSSPHSKPFTIYKIGQDNLFLASFDQFGQLKSATAFEGHGTLRSLCGHKTESGSDVYIGGNIVNKQLFVSEVQDNGFVVWSDTVSVGHGLIESIAYNEARNSLFVAGSFASLIEYKDISLAGNSSFLDGFLLKLSGDGALRWLQQIGGVRVDECHGVGYDAEDNAYATGFFQQSATFGATTLTNPSDARADIFFVAKYDLEGTPVWALRPSSSGSTYSVGNAIAVKVLPDKGIFANVTGSYTRECQFGNTPPLTGNNSGFFLARLLTNSSAGVTALNEKNLTLKAYPNPSSTNATLEFSTNETSIVEINISDALGRNVQLHKLLLASGKQSVQLDLKEMQEGIYFCTVTSGAKLIGSSKLIVR